MERLFSHPRLILLLLAATVLALGHRALMVRQDNSPDTFFSAAPEALRTYREMVRTFGGDEVVLVQLIGARVDRPGHVLAIDKLARDLARIPGVRQVLSPVRLPEPGPGEDVELPEPEELHSLRAELEALPLFRKLGIYRPEVPALGVAALLVMQGARARLELAGALQDLERKLGRQGRRPGDGQGLHPRVAGLALANAAIDRETRRSLSIFLPAVVGLCLLFGLILFRSLRAVLAMFLPVGGAVALGVAGLELAGESLNLVTGVMPPLVLAVGFAGAIHLLSHYASTCEQKLEPREAISVTIREKVVPTAFAYGTTALGFGSLALSEMPVVRVLGLASAGALLAAMVLVTLGTPALILVLRPRLSCPEHRHLVLERCARFSLQHRVLFLAGGLAAALWAGGGLRQIRSSIDGMELLPRQAPERVAYQDLERAGIGLGNLDLWVHRVVPDLEALLKEARTLAELAAELERIPLVTGSVGAHDILRIAGYRMSGRPELPATLVPLQLTAPDQLDLLQRQLAHYWHPARGLKLTLLTLTGDEQSTEQQRRRILDAARRQYPGTRVDLSGHFAMLIGTPGRLNRTLAESLAVTVAMVALLFAVLLRSVWLAVVGMAVNLLPVAVVLGLMGWLGIPLDVTTAMTGSVVFGLAVDDTFHYLYHRRRSGSTLRAAHVAGQGIVATTMVIAGGFSSLALSGFNPVVRFGLLTATAVLVALATDALLLPALVGTRRDLT